MNMHSNINLDNIIYESILEHLYPFLSSFILFVIGLVLAHVIFPNMYGTLISNITDNSNFDVDLKKIFIVVLPYIMSEIFIYMSDTIDTNVLPKIELSITNKLIEQLLKSEIHSQNIDTTQLSINLKKIFDLREIYHLILVYIMPLLIIFVVIVFDFYSANKNLGIMSFLIMIITFISLIYLSTNCTNKSVTHEQQISLFDGNINDIFRNIDSVFSSGTSRTEINNIKACGNTTRNTLVNKEICNTNLKFIAALMYFFVMIGLNYISTQLYLSNKIDKPLLITSFFMILNLVQHCDAIIYETHNITNNVGKYIELKNYFNQFKIIKHTSSNFINDPSKNITFNNVIFTNNFSKPISLTIKAQKKTAILGNIGSGKTTLLKSLVGFIKYSGDIYIDNININHLSKTNISNMISYVPQKPTLFNRTIYENLAYGTNYTKSEIINALKNINILNWFEQSNLNLDSTVGQHGEKLSGGQRQIIFILRSIIQNKQIILFDEPTSSLDKASKNTIINIINSLNNKTIIVTTHDHDILHHFDYVIKL